MGARVGVLLEPRPPKADGEARAMELAGADVFPRASDQAGCGPEVARMAEHVRRRILNGEFVPGSILVASLLSRRLGVKAPVLHAALSLLDREGLVRPAGLGGRFEIARLAPSDLAAAYEVREVLDSLGARLAADAGLSVDVEERFALATEAMTQARASSFDQDSFARAHASWHLALFDASGNLQLRGSSRLVHVVSHCLVWRSLPPAGQHLFGVTVREMADSVLEDHVRILRAIRRRDPADAARAAGRHIRRSTNFARVVGARIEASGAARGVG
jgi:DNA-binding GntR family transcriptional regulator